MALGTAQRCLLACAKDISKGKEFFEEQGQVCVTALEQHCGECYCYTYTAKALRCDRKPWSPRTGCSHNQALDGSPSTRKCRGLYISILYSPAPNSSQISKTASKGILLPPQATSHKALLSIDLSQRIIWPACVCHCSTLYT